MATHKIKQWQTFLSSSSNKTALINFLVLLWRESNYDDLLENKLLYVSFESVCFQYNGVWNEFPVLYNDNEEADTRMLLHAKDANENNYDKIVIHTPDTTFLF